MSEGEKEGPAPQKGELPPSWLSKRRVENPALMLEYPLLRPGTRGYEVPESFDSCACALTLRSLRGLVLRNAGSKIRLSCWSTHCFDLVPEATKFLNHSIRAPAP